MDINKLFKAIILAAAILQISPATVVPPSSLSPSTTPTTGGSSSKHTTSSPLPALDDQHPINPSDGQAQVTTAATEPLTTTTKLPSTTTGMFDECTEPGVDELQRRLKRENMHGRFPEVALLTKGKNPENTRFFPTPESRQGTRYTNVTCPVELLGVMGDYNVRSICPWIIKEDNNPMRYPPTIMVAQCRCPYCIDPSTEESGFLKDTESSCKPVTFKMKVLHRRECVMGIYLYESVYEEIPVACSCVRTITV